MLAILDVLALAQTRLPASQLRDVIVSPIASFERSQCIGADKTKGWDCSGLQLIRVRLVDGTQLGPYVAIAATPEMAADAKWQSVPLMPPK